MDNSYRHVLYFLLVSEVLILQLSSCTYAQVCQLEGTMLPSVSCNFTDDVCGYKVDSFWIRHSGEYKRSSFFGPHYSLTAASTTEKTSGGYYIAYDPHGRTEGNHHSWDNFMTSPLIPTGSYCISFWYVKASTASAFTIRFNPQHGSSLVIWNTTSGVSAHVWTQAALYIQSSENFTLYFHALGAAGQYMIGIDDIGISKVLPKSTMTSTYRTEPTTEMTETVTTQSTTKPTTIQTTPISPTTAPFIKQLTTATTHITTLPTLASATTGTTTVRIKPIIETTRISSAKTTSSAANFDNTPSLCLTGPCLEDAISHSCSMSHWNITVNMTLLNTMYPQAGMDNIFLGESSCTGQVMEDSLIFAYTLRECLTSEKISRKELIYENDLMYNVVDPINPFLIRQHKWTFTVECDVTRTGASSSHVHHDVEHHHEAANLTNTISQRFYRDSNFHDEIPGNPLHVNVGDNVYVKVFTATADWDVKLRLDTCYTTPSTDAPDTMKYYIIQDGCETDRNTHIISQSSHETTFVFQDFEYISNHEGLDLSCSATFCDSSDYSVQCRQSCHSAGPSIVG